MTNNFQFISEPHSYILKGKSLPHPTGIIKHFGMINYDAVNQGLLDYSAVKGQSIHQTTMALDKGELDMLTLNPVMYPYLEAWSDFTTDYKVEAIEHEYCNYSEKYGFGYTIDLIAKITNRAGTLIAIIDKKSGTVENEKAWRIQTALYQIGWNERNPDKKALLRLVVRLDDTGKYNPIPYTEKIDLNVALSALQVYNFINS